MEAIKASVRSIVDSIRGPQVAAQLDLRTARTSLFLSPRFMTRVNFIPASPYDLAAFVQTDWFHTGCLTCDEHIFYENLEICTVYASEKDGVLWCDAYTYPFLGDEYHYLGRWQSFGQVLSGSTPVRKNRLSLFRAKISELGRAVFQRRGAQ